MKKTGGGKPKDISFTPIEESVIKLLSLDEATSGMTDTLSFGYMDIDEHDIAATVVESEINEIICSDIEDVEINKNEMNMSAKTRTPKNKKTPTTEVADYKKLLETQIQIQTEVTDTLKNINQTLKSSENYVHRIASTLDKLYGLKKKKFDETVRVNNEKLKLRQQEIEISLKKIQIKESQMNV